MSKTEVDKTDGCMEPEACIQHIESLGCDNQIQTEGKAPPPLACASDFSFPDGGYQAWLTVIAGWLTLVASIGFTNALAVFQSYYGATVLSEYSADDISWIGSIQFWGCFFFFWTLGWNFIGQIWAENPPWHRNLVSCSGHHDSLRLEGILSIHSLPGILHRTWLWICFSTGSGDPIPVVFEKTRACRRSRNFRPKFGRYDVSESVLCAR